MNHESSRVGSRVQASNHGGRPVRGDFLHLRWWMIDFCLVGNVGSLKTGGVMDGQIDRRLAGVYERESGFDRCPLPSFCFFFSFSIPSSPQPDFIILMDLLRLQTLFPWGPLSFRLARHKTEKTVHKEKFSIFVTQELLEAALLKKKKKECFIVKRINYWSARLGNRDN